LSSLSYAVFSMYHEFQRPIKTRVAIDFGNNKPLAGLGMKRDSIEINGA